MGGRPPGSWPRRRRGRKAVRIEADGQGLSGSSPGSGRLSASALIVQSPLLGSGSIRNLVRAAHVGHCWIVMPWWIRRVIETDAQ